MPFHDTWKIDRNWPSIEGPRNLIVFLLGGGFENTPSFAGFFQNTSIPPKIIPSTASAYNMFSLVQLTLFEQGTKEVLRSGFSDGCRILDWEQNLDKTAGGGHLSVVEWLHANRSEGCTREAMVRAASGGHLSVVEWLHANRSEGCNTWAMNGAAGEGHLSVVEWLHANR
ncbi:unnamed protein product, partial [Heterosigma akashiwo]